MWVLAGQVYEGIEQARSAGQCAASEPGVVGQVGPGAGRDSLPANDFRSGSVRIAGWCVPCQ